MEEIGKILKDILELTSEYSNFTVIAFLIILAMLIEFFKTKDKIYTPQP